MTGAIAIFVKTPGLSPVKSRLAATQGRAYAERWYLQAARAVAEVARAAQAEAGAVYWAVAEPAAIEHALWSGLPHIEQGDGELGQRMAQVHGVLVERHGGGILVGADAPQLRVMELQRALAWLDVDAPRQVIGPARDGGFWLYGSNRVSASSAWAQVRYSAADTAQQFRASLDLGPPWLGLEALCDVDTAADLAACRAALGALDAPTPAQQALAQWMAQTQPAAASA